MAKEESKSQQTEAKMANDLVLVDERSAVDAFSSGDIEKIVLQIEAVARSIVTDATTEDGRKDIAAIAYKIARSKTLIDDKGKEITDEWKTKSKAIDLMRKIARDRLDALKDEIRKPLTDFENAEKERVASISGHIEKIRLLSVFDFNPAASQIEERLCSLETYPFSAWQEFQKKADDTKSSCAEALKAMLVEKQKYEAEQAELIRLRAEAEERKRKDREESIAREAAEKAKAEAEKKALEEAAKIEAARLTAIAEKAEAEARLARAEAEAKAAAEKAEADRIAAEAKAKRDAEAAVEAEKKKQAAEKAEAERQAAAREANKSHKAKVNNEAASALVASGLTAEAAKSAVIAIASGNVPNVKIIY